MATTETSRSSVRLPAVINERLEEVRRRESWLRLKTGLVDALALFLAAMFVALVIDWTFTIFSTAVRQTLTFVSLGIGAAGLLVLAALPQLKRRTLAELAAEVDSSVLGLEERWQTVTEISTSSDAREFAGSPAMFNQVVSEAVEREGFVDIDDVVSSENLAKHRWILAGVVAAHLLLFAVDAPQAWVLVRRFLSPASPVSLTQVSAVGGDLVVPRGEPLRLEAEVTRRPRDVALLFLQDTDGNVTEVKLSPADKEGARFVHPLAAIQQPFSYRFRAGDGETEWHQVTVHDRPRLTGVQFRLSSPEYTGLPAIEKTELPAKVRAVEGSTLEIGFTVDQPLDRFELEFGKDELVTISPDGADPLHYVFRQKLDKTIRFSPVFVSRLGLENQRVPSCQVVVYADRAPQVTIISPDKEISVRPEDNVEIDINARDDFGVARAELIAYVGEAPDMENAVTLPAQPVGDVGKTESPVDAAPTETGTKPSTEDDPANPASTESTNSVAPAKTEQPAENNSSNATGKSDPVKDSSEKLADASKNPAKTSSPSTADKSTKPGNMPPAGANRTSNAGAPPKTIVMPIPLADQTGGKNIRGKVKLDVGQFQLKQGEQVQYMVRVYDSRNTSSKGQSHAGMSQPQNSMAQADPKPYAPSSSPNSISDAKPQASAADAASQASTNPQNPSNGAPAANPKDSTGNPQGAPSQPNTPSNASPTNGVARVASEQTPQNSSNGQPNSSSGQSTPQDAANSQASSGQSSSQNNPPDPGSQKSPPSEPSQGQVTGAPQPENPMTRRKLDVESQSAASSTMRIHIDQWAGSFQSQQREKLELQIDPVLKELDAVLAKALEYLKPVSQAAREGKSLEADHKKSVQAAETQIERGETLVADLVKKSDGTPYAFIGLQLVDITELHISPAHVDVKGVSADPAEKQASHLQQAEFHLERARAMLADLTKAYENVKRNVRLVEEFQRIKNMYQVFVEDSLAMLGSSKPGLNDRDRKMVELELDKEFLEKYTELQKRWQEILAELAKALAKDPRLLERYMSMSRKSVDTLRDQLTLLNNRQKELLVPTEQLLKPAEKTPKADTQESPKAAAKPAEPKPATGAELIRLTLIRDMAEIAESAVAVQEDLTTWLPRNLDPSDARIAPLREQAVKVAGAAGQAAVAKPDGAETAKLTEKLAAELKTFEDGLAALATSVDTQLAQHVNRRLARVRGMQQKLATWSEKQVHVKDSQLHRALELDQHRLAEDTLTLVDKLENLEAQLGAMPEDVLTLGDELRDIIRYDVLVDQMSSELRLREADVPAARDHQKRALDGLARAEVQFDKLIDRVIAEQDKVPPDVPDIDNMQLPTLEELLARLEAEQDLAELLGIPNRPTNLQQMQDWLMRSRGGTGMGQGLSAAASGRSQMLERARQDAMRSIRRAGETGNARGNANPVRRWNTVASQLDDVLRQGRGNTPPKQYRRAIERYFELISGAGEPSESKAPAQAPAAPEKK